MVIRHRTRTTLRNKIIMAIQEEVGECHCRIEEEARLVQRKDRPQQMDIEVVMIREEVARVEDIQMEVRQLEEEVALHHWSGRLLRILDVSRLKDIV